MSKAKTLRLILGDQLNERHSWFRENDQSVIYVLMEVLQEVRHVTPHVQKVVTFFASMRTFADWLRSRGHQVVYISLDDPNNQQAFDDNIALLIDKGRFKEFQYLLPDNYRVDVLLKEMAKRLPVRTLSFDTEHFLASRNEVTTLFSGKKRYLMETFYRYMRKKFDILMVEGKPFGEKWNYDVKNRSRYDERVSIPKPVLFNNDVADIVTMLERMKVTTFGEIIPEGLIWPITRQQAIRVLNDFLTNGLPYFGTYQDAMTEKSWVMFHSRLSFALNTKMLHPMEVINGVIHTWENCKDTIGINQIEGYIRQILGWREFMRGMYWTLMPEFKTMNFFNHTHKLPHYYWDAQTRMNCMRNVLSQSLKHAYAHHIQRLMVTGNFALLTGIHPDDVDAWYLGVYIDAIDWVETTNTRGMSQFADGGIIATKPYVSSSNYLHAMSDYCEHCYYDRTRRYGSRSCPFNSLYWDFLVRHREKLLKNHRVGIMYRPFDNMADNEKTQILRQADFYKNTLDTL